MERVTRKDLAAVLALAAAVCSLFWEALLFRGAFFAQDIMVQSYPFRHFFSLTVESGEVFQLCYREGDSVWTVDSVLVP